MAAVLADPAAAGVRPQVVAMLAFIRRMVEDPDALGPADAAAARAAGIPDEGLRTAIHIVLAFTMIVRLADTFDFAIPTAAQFRSMGKMLVARGYAKL